jgi:hypothetical protein
MRKVFILAIGFILSQSLLAQNPFQVGTETNATLETQQVTKDDVVIVECRQWKAAGYQNAQKSGESFEIKTPMYIIDIYGSGINNFTITRTDNVRFSKTFTSEKEAKNFKLEPGKYSILPNRPKDKSAIDAWDVNLALVLSPVIK